jgi:hypothetical protein
MVEERQKFLTKTLEVLNYNQDFLKVGTGHLELIREQGWERVSSRLDKWLAEASAQGSGDDITVGLICCVSELPKTQVEQAASLFMLSVCSFVLSFHLKVIERLGEVGVVKKLIPE